MATVAYSVSRMRRRSRSLSLGSLVVLALAAIVAGCGAQQSTERHATPLRTPPSMYAGMPGRGTPGERVYEKSGCAACHRIGTVGNPGPGPRLMHVGARLDRAKLRHVLLYSGPRTVMPSFRGLPPAELDALVTYLSRLR